MNPSTFDDLTKALATSTSRRQVLKTLAATGLGGMLSLFGTACGTQSSATPCTNTSSDPQNCGACGKICSAPANATAACKGGMCSFVCNPGFTLCGGACMNTVNDLNNCGSCGNVCPTPTNGQTTCSNGKCINTCNPGYADCDGNPANGCEANIQSDVNNCGACGHQCTTQPRVAAVGCISGVCIVDACFNGYFDCNANLADGCECAGTGCCPGGVCQSVHYNGVGDRYYDCNPPGTPGNPGTYNSQMAMDACAAFTGVRGLCTISNTCGIGKTVEFNQGCFIWDFGNVGTAGHVSSSGCSCPTAASATWT